MNEPSPPPLDPAARSKFAANCLRIEAVYASVCVCARRFLCRRHAFSHFTPVFFTVAARDGRVRPSRNKMQNMIDEVQCVVTNGDAKEKQPALNDLRCLFFRRNKRRHYPTVWIHALETAGNGCGGEEKSESGARTDTQEWKKRKEKRSSMQPELNNDS